MKTKTKIKYRGIPALWDGHAMDFSETLFPDEDKEAIVGGHYEVCEACEGRGTTTSHIEPDGGGFTSSEWAEACYEDPDFAEDYLTGKYDRPCPNCKGRNVVPCPDDDADPEIMKLIEEHVRSEAAYLREEAYARKHGF